MITLSKLGIEGNYLNITKDILENTTAKIIFNGEKNGGFFLLKLGTKQGYLFSPLLFSILLKILATIIWQEKKASNCKEK